MLCLVVVLHAPKDITVVPSWKGGRSMTLVPFEGSRLAENCLTLKAPLLLRVNSRFSRWWDGVTAFPFIVPPGIPVDLKGDASPSGYIPKRGGRCSLVSCSVQMMARLCFT